MKRLDDLILATITLLVAVSMWFSGCAGAGPALAAAQARHDDEQLVEDAVRLAFHESVSPLDDVGGIYSALVNGAAERNISTHAFARSYAPRFFSGRAARGWWLGLRMDCSRPVGFMGNWTLPRRDGRPALREVCLATVERARSYSTPPCEATAWGSVADYRNGPHAAAHANDVFVDCGGDARNLFSRPRRAGE